MEIYSRRNCRRFNFFESRKILLPKIEKKKMKKNASAEDVLLNEIETNRSKIIQIKVSSILPRKGSIEKEEYKSQRDFEFDKKSLFRKFLSQSSKATPRQPFFNLSSGRLKKPATSLSCSMGGNGLRNSPLESNSKLFLDKMLMEKSRKTRKDIFQKRKILSSIEERIKKYCSESEQFLSH